MFILITPGAQEPWKVRTNEFTSSYSVTLRLCAEYEKKNVCVWISYTQKIIYYDKPIN